MRKCYAHPMPTLPFFLEPVIALAKQAGEAILAIYNTSTYTIQTKSDNSPLTAADLSANKILTDGLKQLTPTWPILSEENLLIPWQERQKWQRYWLIDPLDGTQQFIQQSGEFSVNIALIENHQPIFGLIYIPITEECYYASAGDNAYKLTAQGNHTRLSIHAWRAADTILLSSHGANRQRLDQCFAQLGDYTLIKKASAWKFCLLAEGKADLSPRFGDTSEWDTAAGQCILQQAGGNIFDLHGIPLHYNTQASVLNPYFVALGDLRLYPLLPWGNWPLIE